MEVLQTRQNLVDNLKHAGMPQEALDSMNLVQLQTIHQAVSDIKSHRPQRKRTMPSEHALSATDKVILRGLLTTKGFVSSLQLSKQLHIPLSTIQRRRKKLEEKYICTKYEAIVSAFHLRTAFVLVATSGGKTESVAKQLIKHDEVLANVRRILSSNGSALVLTIHFRDNTQLAEYLRFVESIDGVTYLQWYEDMGAVGESVDQVSCLLEEKLE